MNTRMHHFTVPALLLCILAASAESATVTVNDSIKYQKMDGFGASIADGLYSHNNNTAYINTVVNDLGATIMRMFLIPDFCPSQGTFTASTSSMQTMLTVITKYRQAGLPRICLSIFTPPAWMKDNNSLTNGGHLDTNKYSAFADFYTRYIDTIQTRCSAPVYAISPQNEAAFVEPYNSCVYTFSEMSNVVDTLGKRFAADKMPIKIFAAEDIQTNTWKSYAQAIFSDASAKHYDDIIAIHHQDFDLSTSGIIASYTQGRQLVETCAKLAGKAPYSVGYWNSEISGYPDGWTGTLSMAEGFMISLRDGKMNLLMYGSPSIPSSENQNKEALMVDLAPTPRYYVAKQFFRYIRPGAVMVNAPCDDSTVMAAAWVHDSLHTMTIVFVNTSSVTKTVTLSGRNLPHFTAIRTSATENCDTIGAVGSITTSVQLPDSSVTTLYGTGYVSSIKIPEFHKAHTLGNAAPGKNTDWYTIDGKTMLRGASARQMKSTGLYIAVSRDAAGMVVGTQLWSR